MLKTKFVYLLTTCVQPVQALKNVQKNLGSVVAKKYLRSPFVQLQKNRRKERSDFLLSQYKYKTELHAHTKPISYCSDIEAEKLIDLYKQLDTDAVVLTNHFTPEFFQGISKSEGLKKYYGAYSELSKLGDKAGINIILGVEIKFTENSNEYLIYGIKESDLEIAYECLDKGIDFFYKIFKNDQNLILQAHPFRNGMILANPKSIDGIEVFNMHPSHNSRVAKAAEYAKKHNFIISGGTDFHHDTHQGCCFLKTKELPNSSFDIAKILKSKDFIFDIFGNTVLPYNFV